MPFPLPLPPSLESPTGSVVLSSCPRGKRAEGREGDLIPVPNLASPLQLLSHPRFPRNAKLADPRREIRGEDRFSHILSLSVFITIIPLST